MENRPVKLPLRAIHLVPEFTSSSALQRVRMAHDPLAGKIPPHITLVFPFQSDLTPVALAQHAGEVTSSAEAFPVALGRPQMRRNGLIWLPVTEGRAEVVSLNQQLYREPLSAFQSLGLPYEPHVTIARGAGSAAEAAFEMANRMTETFTARVDRLVIEEIMPDDSSRIESTIWLDRAGRSGRVVLE